MYLRLIEIGSKLFITRIGFLVAGLLIIFSCSDEDDPPTPVGSAEKEIIDFTFLASANTAFLEDVKTTVNKNENTITATVAFGTDVTALKPKIEISEKASITPENETAGYL